VTTCLITGATAGIGAAFARQLAAAGHDLVLVARDAPRLDEVAAGLVSAHGVRAVPLAADLATPAGCELVESRLRADTDPVDLLVNNAGMTLNRSFLATTVADEERLLHLNVHAVMRLTHAVLPGMVRRGRGSVVNVSSVSGFAAVMPGSTYPATKAWVTNFTESVALAVRPKGVRVMALCPGYTRTEFHDRAGIRMSKTPKLLWLDADNVVRAGLRDLARGRFISVPDWRYKVAVLGLRHAPSGLMRRAAQDSRGKIK
jgi:short-subunit dehydrogenase